MENTLVKFVLENVDEWRDHRDDNYQAKWKEYEDLWRGNWSDGGKTRDSERSKIISPALQQAVENHCAEIEEAIFGSGDYLFDIQDDLNDSDPKDVEYIKNFMKQEFKKNKVRKAVGDILLLASVFGTGIGEITTKDVLELVPATQPVPNTGAMAVGTEEKTRTVVYLKPINPNNFIIDPTSSTIEEAMGCAIEEYVSAYTIEAGIKSGMYKDVDITEDLPKNSDLEASSLESVYEDDRVHIIRYYGLVPENLLESGGDGESVEVVELFDSETVNQEYANMVEAIIVIANGDKLIKAERSPYMMKDRPLVAFQDDTIPNRFWGRGIAEKAYNMQKAIDAQLRSHLDALALTSVPMVAMDATRLPRGSKFEVRPGKSVLTNGNPNEILMPFKFGQIDGSNIETAARFEQMLLQATGTLDNASLQQGGNAGGNLSISLSGLIKKNKRTLVNFQDNFLIPFIEKVAFRYMQFSPESFPVKDWKFVPMSSLGMLAREVEQMQLINLLKTLGDSAITPILLVGVLKNSSLPDKQVMIDQIMASQQPDPKAEQLKQLETQLIVQKAQADVALVGTESQLNQAKAAEHMSNANLAPRLAEAKIVAAISTNLPNDDAKIAAEFDRRVRVAELMLKEKDMQDNKEIVRMQMAAKDKGIA